MRLDTCDPRVRRLRDAIRSIEAGGGVAHARASSYTRRITDAADLLAPGRVHEWFADDPGSPRGDSPAPMGVLVLGVRHLYRVLAQRGERRAVLWIGRCCWPYALVLGEVLPVSVFLDPPDLATRVWTMDATLRCSGVAVVVADGGALDMAASRRLQLAAEIGGVTALLARPWRERTMLSAAATRWRVWPAQDPSVRPGWALELLRCKGLRPGYEAPRHYRVEWDHAPGTFALPAPLDGGTDPASGQHSHTRSVG